MKTTTQDGGKSVFQSPFSSWSVPKQKSELVWWKVMGFFLTKNGILLVDRDGYRERPINWGYKLLKNGYPAPAILVPGGIPHSASTTYLTDSVST
jgi:1-acyl-sn-glycerol-3-phosphate acyltransferase